MELSLRSSTATITIDGGTAGITVDGNSASRVFQVDAGVHAVLTHLAIGNGNAGAANYGGGIANWVALSVSGSTISGCSAALGGAGILNFAGLTLSQDKVSNNTETRGGNGGGGILSWGRNTTLTIDGTTISNNHAAFTGGGISLIDGGGLTLTNSTITGNSSARDGGGITLQSLTANVTATATNSTIAGNTANGSYSGGGILVISSHSGTSASLTLQNCTVANNAAGQGGGLANVGSTATLTVSNSTLSGNAAQANNGSLTVTSSSDYGGGIYNASGAALTLTNSTLAANHSWYGGGLSNFGTLTVWDATIAGNKATYGGGIFNYPGFGGIGAGVLKLQGTLVAGNSASSVGPDVNGPVAAGSAYNLIWNGTAAMGISNGANHNQVGANTNPTVPWLGLLGSRGGPTQTMALLPGSPALGAGEGLAGVTTDQRGDTRPATPDVGAYQDQVFLSTLTPAQWTVNRPYAGAITVGGGANANLAATGLPTGLSAPLLGRDGFLDRHAVPGGHFPPHGIAVAPGQHRHRRRRLHSDGQPAGRPRRPQRYRVAREPARLLRHHRGRRRHRRLQQPGGDRPPPRVECLAVG